MDVSRVLGSMAATALGVLSVTLMVTASAASSALVLIGWALLSAMGAALVTAWQIIERHHTRIMDYLAHQDLRLASAVSTALRGSSREGRPTPLR